MSYTFSEAKLIVDHPINYYVEVPETGKVIPINWVQYEHLKLMGFVHRIMTEKQAVLHFIKKGNK